MKAVKIIVGHGMMWSDLNLREVPVADSLEGSLPQLKSYSSNPNREWLGPWELGAEELGVTGDVEPVGSIGIVEWM